MKLKTLTIGSALSLSLMAAAAEQPEFTLPYIHPDQDCITEGMTNPPGKDYRYLYSKDCRVVHVLPPSVISQSVDGKTVNMDLCSGYFSNQRSQDIVKQTLEEGNASILNYERELLDNPSAAKEKTILRRMESLKQRMEGYKNELEGLKAFEKIHFDPLPGAVFTTTLKSEVGPSDLQEIRAYNLQNLNRRTEIEKSFQDADGNIRTEKSVIYKHSSLRAAPISSSIFSFTHVTPENSRQNGGISSVHFPQLEYLQQQNGQTNTIHVKANGVSGGEIQMAIPYVCQLAHLNDQSKYEVPNEKLKTILVVNQTMEVKQMFGKGYFARLRVDNVVDQVIKHVTTSSNNGFQKSSLFEPIINGKLSELLEFVWYDEHDIISKEEEKEIFNLKKEIAAEMIDDYFDNLVKAGVLKIYEHKLLPPAEGGLVDEAQTENRCWNERRGGVGGFFGRTRRVCRDFTYTVKVWHDGVNTDQLKTDLKINIDLKRTMRVNKVAPFYFTTSFTTNPSK